MRKIKIALDCDGVLANFTAGALRIVEEVTGHRYTEADVTEFDFVKALGLSARSGREVKKRIGSRCGFAAALAPYPRARQGVRRLRELGDVICVTSPWDTNPWWRAEREAWLALHVGIDVVHHDHDKRGVDCDGYGADVFVDDKAEHVQAWSRAWPGRADVFWKTRHNTSEVVPAGAHATDSWDVLYQIAHEVALRPAPVVAGQEEMSL